MRRRNVYAISRSGGGNYHRGGRRYRSSICAECAIGLLHGAGVHAGATCDRFDVSTLDKIVSGLGTTEAAEVFTAFRDRRDQYRARNDELRDESRRAMRRAAGQHG